MQLERQFAGPLRDTLIQRWRDPVDGTTCYLYLPILGAHSAPTASGYVEYGANTIGSISCSLAPKADPPARSSRSKNAARACASRAARTTMSKQAPQSGSKNVQFGLLLATVFSVSIRSAPAPAYAPGQQQARSGDAFANVLGRFRPSPSAPSRCRSDAADDVFSAAART